MQDSFDRKALKQHKIASLLFIGSAIHGLALSIDDIIILGADLSAFVLPYLFNYFAFFFSVFHLYASINFKLKQKWTKNAVFWILAVRILLSMYDILEIIPVLIVLPYYLYAYKYIRKVFIRQD
jgi:hypothetical protein